MTQRDRAYAAEERYYLSSPQDAARLLGADTQNGLSEEEAARRLQKFGANAFEKQRKKSMARLILSQLKDVSAIILIIAAALSLTMAIIEWEGPQSLIEPFVVFAIIIMNVILAVTQDRNSV